MVTVDELQVLFTILRQELSDLHGFLSVPRPSCRTITVERVAQCLHHASTFEMALVYFVERERRIKSGIEGSQQGTT
jgi:hypothetical protein